MYRKSKTFLPVAILIIVLALYDNSFAKGDSAVNNQAVNNRQLQKATFAGGCFWCMEPVFDKLEGVKSTAVGYSGGFVKNPTYEQVIGKDTGHLEVIQVEYDPVQVSYDKLLEEFFRNIDPLDPLGQFADKGPQYLSAVFYHSKEQKEAAENYIEKLEKSEILDGEVVTDIKPFEEFYMAEEYHQDYYKKNPIRYNAFKYGSGRPARLKEVWGDKAE